MMRLIYEKPSLAKVKMIRKIIENNGKESKEKLVELFGFSSSTLEKYILELQLELPVGVVCTDRCSVFFNEKKYSLYDVQMFYLSKSITKDVLHHCFFSPSHCSLEKLAQKLYISPSKLFTVLKYLECQLKDIGLRIVRTPTVSLIGPAESILIIYNLLLHLEEQPFKATFTQLDKQKVEKEVIRFFETNHIRVEPIVIKEFSLWLLAVNEQKFLESHFSTELGDTFPNRFIDLNCQVGEEVRILIASLQLSEKVPDDVVIELIMVFILFNSVGLHFDCIEKEREFFNTDIQAEFVFQELLLCFLLKDDYHINTNNLKWASLKIEGSLHYYRILAPYFDLYGEFFNPRLESSPHFQQMVLKIQKDVSFFFQEEEAFFLERPKVAEFLAHIISSFQENYFQETIYRIGVSSIKGTGFEKQLCEELRKTIEILPCHEFYQNDQIIDLLIVDDLRLLNGTVLKDYNQYVLLGDYYTNLKKQTKRRK